MAKKGENIYHRKDGRWEGRYCYGLDSDGSKKYRSVYGATYGIVKEKLNQCKGTCDLNRTNTCHLTVEELSCLWLLDRKNKVKPSTYARYHFLSTHHIVPYFGKTKVEFLTVKELLNFSTHKRNHGKLGGGGLSPKSVHDLVSAIKSMLHFAQMFHGLVCGNLDMVLPPVPKNRTATFSLAESRQVASHIIQHPSPTNMGFLLAWNTGLRLGELCGLRWSDFDSSAGTVTVSRTACRVALPDNPGKTALILQTPKSQTSARTIPLPMDMQILLEQYAVGKKTTDYLISQNGTTPAEPRTIQYRFARLLKDCGLPQRNFHAVRHTYATMCMEKNMDAKTISELLGHANVQTTLHLYVHPSSEHKRNAVQQICYLPQVVAGF